MEPQHYCILFVGSPVMREIARQAGRVGEVTVRADILHSTALLITLDYVKMNYTVLSPCLAAIKPWGGSLLPALVHLNGKPIAAINNTIV